MLKSIASRRVRRKTCTSLITRLRAVVAAAACAAVLPLAGQDVANGTLLVAAAELRDPNFSRSVVLVLRSDENGTVGVVLNRPTTLEPAVVFPELAQRVGTYTGRLFRGGPIAPTQLVFIVRGLAAATIEGPEVLDKVFLSINAESLTDMARLANGTDELRVYAGHAAWVPDQLDAEIRAGGWRLVPGTAELVFHTDPGELWNELDRRAVGASDLVAAAGGR